jgi:hypothetical protein
MLAGREADSLGLARGVFLTIGHQALSDIKDDYMRKSKLGTQGEDGVTWPELKPATIAGRRLGPGDRQLPHIAERLKSEKDAAKAARARFTADAKVKRKKLVARFLMSMPPDEARARAQAVIAAERAAADFGLRGKIAVTGATGQKRVDVMSQRSVEILRDTGVLLNSLSPGEISGGAGSKTYSAPSGDGGDKQVFKLFESGIIVGTTVAYASTHQFGNPARKIPARPFLPINGVPSVWADRWTQAGHKAIKEAAALLYSA